MDCERSPRLCGARSGSPQLCSWSWIFHAKNILDWNILLHASIFLGKNFVINFCTIWKFNEKFALFCSLCRSPEGPYVVGVVELVACDLLLVAGAPPIWVLQRVGVVVGVEPAGEVGLTEAELRPVAKHYGTGGRKSSSLNLATATNKAKIFIRRKSQLSIHNLHFQY